MKRLILFIVILSFRPVLSGTIHPENMDKDHINLAENFECVLPITGTYKNGISFKGSCVAISSHYILTAAHVVQDYDSAYVYVKDKRVNIVSIKSHENFEKPGFGYGDIALCKSEQDLSIKNYPELYTQADESDKKCYLAGYGTTGTFLTGNTKDDSLKRAGTNIIDRIEKNLLVCTASSTDKTELEFLTTIGDSGGGLFISNKLAGINSCGFAADGKSNGTYKDESGHTRISLFVEWIKNNTE